MLHLCPRILAEATSTLIQTFFIVFFLNFITYDGRKYNEQRAKSNEKRATSKKFSLIMNILKLK